MKIDIESPLDKVNIILALRAAIADKIDAKKQAEKRIPQIAWFWEKQIDELESLIRRID